MSFTSAARRDLTVVAAGRGVSVAGDEVAVIALALWASHEGAGAMVVAALVMAAALPQLLAAPVAGLIVDRLPARRLIATVSLLQALVCLALVPAVAAAHVPAVLALVVALNLGQTVANPAWQALVPVIAGPEQLSRALAVLQGTTAAAALLGPAVGGLLVGATGTSAALVVDAVTFAVLGVAALLLRHDRRPEAPAPGMRGELTAGVRVIAGDPVLRGVLLLVTAFVLTAGAVNVAEIFLITRTLGAGPAAYGAVGALFAAGLMLGAWLSRRDRTVTAAARLLVGVTVSLSLSLVALGLAPTLVVAALASMAVGVCNGMLNVLGQSIFVRRAPKAVLGRVFAALQGVVGAAMLAATALGGVLLGVLDVRTLIVGAGVLAVAVLLVVGRPLLTAREPRSDDAPPTGDRVAAVLATEGGDAA
ncbi:MAG: MFS transporter [Actinomycetales bacterium]|nr:MFS transporter [Actinomycetales bacterium]